MEDDDDDYKYEKRAAPTRKRNFIKDPLVPGLEPNEDKNAEQILEKLTGKRFSLTELLKRKSKKDDSTKDDSQKDDSKKEVTNEEANIETEEKQAESKDG